VTLRRKIAAEIARAGPIPFSRYMDLCLYDPEFGYYTRHAEQFGKAGDFYTSSDVHAVFGRLLARQFDEMWRALGTPARLRLLELGPGRGLFAQDVLDWSQKKFPALFAALEYACIERSPALRARIAATLARHIRAGKLVVREALPDDLGGPAIVFANEFFDAFPVEVVTPRGQLFISADQDIFVETFAPVRIEVLEFLDRYAVHAEPGERVEACTAAHDFMAQLAAALRHGFVVVVDYGYTRAEQLAGRHRGTVTAFRQHVLSPSPYDAPGEQDITADVNFTALEAAAERGGLHTLGLVTQAQFLMGIGENNQFADAFQDCGSRQEQAKVALQLKHLVTPAGMGESFHALVMAKGVEAVALSGLKFARAEHSP
jgi:SAM-dependent MidA family methyltransferase